MSFRRRPLPYLVALSLMMPAAAQAQKLDKESKAWLDDVASIILPDEEKTFKKLKDKGDRVEFQKIFWARRDPDPDTPENEFQVAFEKARVEADKKFRSGVRVGSQTDCGRVLILFGAPADVRQAPEMESGPSATGRTPEIWVYRGPQYKGGEIEIAFSAECEVPTGPAFRTQLDRYAESKIIQPNLGYRLQKDGRLVTLDELTPRTAKIRALLREPRQDFPLSIQQDLAIKAPGGTYVAGLLRADAAAIESGADPKSAKLAIGAAIVDEAGKLVGMSERASRADAVADTGLVAGFGLVAKPGAYTLRVAVLNERTGKGSVAAAPITLSNFEAEEAVASKLMLLAEIQEGVKEDQEDPRFPFVLGTSRLVPRLGNAFQKTDSLNIVGFLYSPKVDPATGKPSATASVAILKDGKPVARAEDQVHDTDPVQSIVGPVPLEKFEPGKYSAQIKFRDNVAKKDVSQEVPFEVK
jgi:GWxTD domain-containing protein